MKKALSVLVALGLTFSLAACSSGGSNTASSTASSAASEAESAAEEAEEAATEEAEEASEEASEAESAEEAEQAEVSGATVTIWHSYTEDQLNYLEQAVSDFNAANPGMTVVQEFQPREDFENKVYQAVMAGNGPDILIHYASEAANYVADGKVIDLEEYLAPETVAMLPSSFRTEATSFADGKLHILPIVSSGPILFYNADLYDELGLSAPATWEELQANCDAIREAHPEISGFGFDSETDGAATLIMQTGNQMIDAENVYFNTEEVADQMRYYQDNIANGNFTNVKIDGYFSNNFNQGLLGAYVGSVAGLPYIGPDNSGPNVGMGMVPQGGSVNWTPAWNRGIIIFDYDDEDRARTAAAFADYFAQPEVNAGWCVACNYPAVFEETMATDTYQAFVAENEAFTYLHPEYAGAFPAVTAQAYTRTALQTMMSEVAGGTDVYEAIQSAEDYILDELANE